MTCLLLRYMNSDSNITNSISFVFINAYTTIHDCELIIFHHQMGKSVLKIGAIAELIMNLMFACFFMIGKNCIFVLLKKCSIGSLKL